MASELPPPCRSPQQLPSGPPASAPRSRPAPGSPDGGRPPARRGAPGGGTPPGRFLSGAPFDLRIPGAAVDRIADDRQARRRQVDADLVRPPRDEAAPQQGQAEGEPLALDLVERPRRRAISGGQVVGRRAERLHLLRSRGSRPIASATSPLRTRGTPATSARYSFFSVRGASAARASGGRGRSSRRAARPRCRGPAGARCRAGARRRCPARSRTWCSSALTSVPEAWPGAGCTTSPGGLSIAISSSSS